MRSAGATGIILDLAVMTSVLAGTLVRHGQTSTNESLYTKLQHSGVTRGSSPLLGGFLCELCVLDLRGAAVYSGV